MPICEDCQQKWTWKQTQRNLLTLNPTLICPYCSTKQYQTQKAKTIGSIFIMIILLPLLLQVFLEILGIVLIGLFAVLLMLTVLLYPFIVELSSKEKYINLF